MNRFTRLIFFLLILPSLIFAQENESPKNIILLIGDGMGLNYVSADVLKHNNSPFKRFSTVGLAITKSIDDLITDSAAAATAIATGYPTKNRYIAMDTSYNKLYTIFEHAEKLGLLTGVVVTGEIVGATPAAFVTHHYNRSEKREIAEQFLNIDIDVVIGGGAKYFLPSDSSHSDKDKINLVDELKSKGYNIYYDFNGLFKSVSSDKVFALLDDEGLPETVKRDYSLGDLTSLALKHLAANEKGFLLMVEGAQIDWAGHDENVNYLLSEMDDFSTALKVAIDFAEKEGNTLVLVTADHETGGMTITDGSFDGENLKIEFLNSHHTAGFVGVFAYGPGEKLFGGIYENYLIGRKIFHLMDESYQFSSNH
ncbi:MAG: alkaline phosphatase [Bacteroidetes bacterium]|nr:alkaline phosphatase [Bacteroidota bacterium]